ncbi:MAG: DegT/DnrJ/EryC1/StrS family aminotransferase [Verrucomicrobiota bacterium]
MNPTIPIQDLKRHYESLAAELKATAQRVLDTGWYVLGQEVKAFEQEFAKYLGAGDCVSVANGTDALELSLRAFDIGPGDEVCTVANAGMYSTIGILSAGARPVFVDVQPDTLTMCPQSLAKSITAKTKAIIVTHLYGCMADIEAVLEIARARNLPVIEDCAQAHGAKHLGRTAGTWGDIGCYSFYPTKNLGALGDGGGLSTNKPQIAERLRRLRQYGWSSRYHSDDRGGRNSRLDELQAAFLRVKLPHLNRWNARRRQIAQAYNDAFKHHNLLLPRLSETHVAHLYVVATPKRDAFRASLTAAGIGNDVHYPLPDYAQKSIRQQLGELAPLTATEKACREIVTLPCFPELTDAEVEKVIQAVHSFFKK